MSVADSTTAMVGQVDDVTQKLSEAMNEDEQSVPSGKRNVGYTTNPPKKTRDILEKTSDKEGTVGYTTSPPFTPLTEEDSDLFGGYTPEDTLGGKFLVSRGIP